MTTFKNYSVDPFDNDQSYPLHIQTTHYSGAYDDFTVPAAANFPDADAGSPTRVFFDFMGIIDVSDLDDTKPFTLYDITDAVELTRTTAAPSDGEYRIVTNTNSIARQKIEFNIAQASHTIGADGYILGGVLSEHEVNLLVKGVTQIVLADVTADDKSKAQADYIINNNLDTAINNILNTYNDNVKISLLSGSYGCTGTGNIDTLGHENIEIEGSGNVVITSNGTTSSLFTIRSNKVAIKNLNIDYTFTASGYSSAILVYASSDSTNINTVLIENINITGDGEDCTRISGIRIRVENTYNINNLIIRHCHIKTMINSSTIADGIFYERIGSGTLTDTIIDYNIIHDFTSTAEYGIYFNEGGSNIVLTNNLIYNLVTNGIYTNSTGTVINNNIVYGCTSDEIYLASTGNWCNFNTVKDGTINDAGGSNYILLNALTT